MIWNLVYSNLPLDNIELTDRDIDSLIWLVNQLQSRHAQDLNSCDY